ncbi:MAG: hypothetical protein ABIA67_05025 [Candidatus Margulisiibacteriota bacterium]
MKKKVKFPRNGADNLLDRRIQYLSCKNGGNPPLANVSIQALCNFGRIRWETRKFPAVQVQFPRHAGYKYLPAGLMYVLMDQVSSHAGTNPKDGSLPVITQPVAGGAAHSPAFLFGSHIMLMQGAMAGGGTPIDIEDAAIKDVGDSVFENIEKNTKHREKKEFTAEEFSRWLKRELKEHPASRELPEDPRWENDVLNYLLGEYKIEEAEIEVEGALEAGYRVANQENAIQRASSIVNKDLPGKQLLRGVFDTAQDVFNELWQTSTHVIYDRKSGGLKLTGRSKGRAEDSPYREWSSPEYLFEAAIIRYVETGDSMFEVDLKAEY